MDIPDIGGYDLYGVDLYNKVGKKLSPLDIESLKCSSCQKLLRDPQQLTGCGHRYCKSCLYQSILKKR